MQEKRFLQQNWLLSPASCRKAEAEVKHEMEAGMQIRKGEAVLVPGPLPKEARHSKQPGDACQPKGSHRTLSSARGRAQKC